MQLEKKRVAVARGGTAEGFGFRNRSHVRLRHNTSPDLVAVAIQQESDPALVNTRGGKSEAALVV